MRGLLVLLRQKATVLNVSALISVGFLGMYYLFLFVVALQSAYTVDTYAANGTFQLYNPLRRLAEGQSIGYDFPFFHGVLVPLLHYPVFAIMGSDLFGAEFAKHFMSPMVFLASSLFFFYAFFRNFQKTVIATAFFTLLAMHYAYIIDAGNSLIGIRSALPIVVAGVMLWKSKRLEQSPRYFNVPYRIIICLVLLALAVLNGTEHGLAASIAFFTVVGIKLLRNGNSVLATLRQLLGYGCALLVLILGFLAIVTGGHPLEALHYALIDIPGDQGWYFGAPPNSYVTFQNLIPWIFTSTALPLNVICGIGLGITIYAIVRKKYSQNIRYAFVFMLIAGFIVFAAGVLGGYFMPQAQMVPLVRLSGLIAVATLVTFIFQPSLIISELGNNKKRALALKLARGGALLAVFAVLVAQAVTTIRYLNFYDPPATIRDARAARHRTDYENSSKNWKERLDAFMPLIPANATVWSTYTSVYDSSLGQLNASPGGEDYIIHALGKERRDAYTEAFVQSESDFAITLKPSYFIYEEWLWGRHEPFYEHLLSHYEIVAKNDAHYLWKRSATPATDAAPSAIIKSDDGRYNISNESDTPKLYSVTMDYAIGGNAIGKQLAKYARYLVDIRGDIAAQYPPVLPPGESSWSFIVALPAHGSAVMTPFSDGLAKEISLGVSSVSYKELRVANKANLTLVDNNECAIKHSELGKHPEKCLDN